MITKETIYMAMPGTLIQTQVNCRRFKPGVEFLTVYGLSSYDVTGPLLDRDPETEGENKRIRRIDCTKKGRSMQGSGQRADMDARG